MDASEHALWRRAKAGDPRAVEALLAQYDYLVGTSIARLGLAEDRQYEDLYQCGRIGLLKAIRVYDPALGEKLDKIAIPKIRGKVLDWKREKDSWVRRTGVRQNSQIAEARALLKRIGIEDPDEAQLRAALSEVTGEAVSSVQPFLEAETLPTLCSLSGGNAEEDGEEDPIERISDRPDDTDLFRQAWHAQNEEIVERALSRLTALQRAAFRGISERGMTALEVAQAISRAEHRRTARRLVALGWFPSEAIEQSITPRPDPRELSATVRKEHAKSLSLVRAFLKPDLARLTGSDRPTNNTQLLTVRGHYRMDAETVRIASALARRWNVTRAEAIRRAVRAGLGLEG